MNCDAYAVALAQARWEEERLNARRNARRLWFAHRLGWSHGYVEALRRAGEVGLFDAVRESNQVLETVLEVTV